MDSTTENFIAQLQLDWKPRVHCSNCKNCIVYRDIYTDRPMARCAAAMGDPVPLERMIGINSKGWRKAIYCPGYEDMDNG